jgi:predicted transcriptional regulator
MNHGPSFIDDVSQRNKGIGVWDEQTCDPELPHDTAEEVFMDAKLRVRIPSDLVPFTAMVNWWCLEVFRQFWKDYEAQEGSGHSSRTFGDEAAIRLLQALQNSHDRRTAMRAECYLAVINRKPESQTQIAKKYGVTRAAVSKVIVSIRDDLRLPTARHMKSDSARQSYRERALRIHKEKKSKICTTQTNSFTKFWASTSSNLKPQKPAPSN